jgi:hypothetical protein
MFEELKREDGMYEDSKGCCYNDVVEYLHESQDWCGFCGCGRPEESLRCLYRCLSLINDFHDGKYDGQYEAWNTEWDKIGSSEVVYVLWYLLDKLALTEHGGHVPGWLTDKGAEMLQGLQESDIDTLCEEN